MARPLVYSDDDGQTWHHQNGSPVDGGYIIGPVDASPAKPPYGSPIRRAYDDAIAEGLTHHDALTRATGLLFGRDAETEQQ